MTDDTKTHDDGTADSVELTLDGPWDFMTDIEKQQMIGLEDEDVELVIFEDDEMERHRLEQADEAVRRFLISLGRTSHRLTNTRYAQLFFERLTVQGTPVLCSTLSNVFDFAHARGGRSAVLCRTTFAQFRDGIKALTDRSREDPLLTPHIDVIESTLTSLEVRTGTRFSSPGGSIEENGDITL